MSECPVCNCCRDGNLGPRTVAYAEGLENSFEELAAVLKDGDAFSPSTNFEGIIGLTTEVPAKKVRLFLHLGISVAMLCVCIYQDTCSPDHLNTVGASFATSGEE